MARVAIIINAILWVALGGLFIYTVLADRREGFTIGLGVFGGVCVLNGLAGMFKWKLWSVTSRVVGAVMVLYAFAVFLLGHGEDVGGTTQWLMLIGASLGLGLWSIVQPLFQGYSGPSSQPCTSPNGGPPTPSGNSGVSGGPPSVS